jgi:hypothetical protein
MMVYQGVLGITVATGRRRVSGTALDSSIQRKSVLRYVTIEYADIGLNCQSVVSGPIDIERCTSR